MNVEVLYFEGCPGVDELLPRLRDRVAGRAAIELHRIDSPEQAEVLGFLGSPTVRVNGVDVEPGATTRTDFGLKCRLYRSGGHHSHAPADEWIARALDRAT